MVGLGTGAGSAADGPGSTRVCGPGARGGIRRSSVRLSRWTPSSTTPGPDDRYRRVRVTHQPPPRASGVYFDSSRPPQNGGEARAPPHDEDGQLSSLPAGWTDVVPADPFAVIADGRCPFTIDGLLALADLIGRLRSQPGSDEAVKRITP